MKDVADALSWAHDQQDRYRAELKEFLAIPSVSTLPDHQDDMHRAAAWVAGQMRSLGLNRVEILPTSRHPVVYGEWLDAPGQPTVLVYGHYDVQPADPLEEWRTPPFEPTIQGNSLVARGASDMKGQVHASLKALEALLQTQALGVNVKLLIEGEEEIGSPSLAAFIDAERDRLACDIALNPDTLIVGPEQPSLVYGLRGLAYFELTIHGPDHDLHSGIFGGSVTNPAQVLCELVGQMHDREGRITLPGFYDSVRVLSAEERAELARVPHVDDDWRRLAGVSQLAGERGYSTLERLGTRPTLEVNGLLSGFTGAGSKTVLPARATAKLSMRLVPYQDPDAVEAQLRDFVVRHIPASVRWDLHRLAGAPAVLVERDTVGMRAAAAALESTFGVQPVFTLEGGSVPVVSLLQHKLGVDSVLMGFGLPDDNLHAPNEKLDLPNYHRGIATFIRFFHNLTRPETL